MLATGPLLTYHHAMRRVVVGLVVVFVLVARGRGVGLAPAAPDRKPVLADSPALQPATRTSVVIAPAAVALAAIRDALEAQAPRDLTGKRENPVGQLLQNAELGWVINRGPLAVSGRPDALTVVAPLNGTFRLTGQIGAQVGNITSQLGGLLGGAAGEQLGNCRAPARSARRHPRQRHAQCAARNPAELAAEPNLWGQPISARQIFRSRRSGSISGRKPLLDRALAEQAGVLQARLRNDPFLEQAARREWAKMCRSIPLGKPAAGLSDLWLEVRPVRAVAAQPKIDASAVTLTVGVQAETRITPAESKPDCPFPATVDIVPPMDQGRVSLGVPIDLPFAEVNKLIEAQLKGKVFPEDKSGPVEVTINRATLAASGNRLLISLRVKANEKTSWFGFGAEATVHVWGKPVLDAAQQVLRLAEIELDVESEAAYGLPGPTARAAIPYVKDAPVETRRRSSRSRRMR